MSSMLRRTFPLIALVAVARLAGAQPPVGPEFQVNTYTTGYPESPSVAAGADGSFVVVWVSDGQDGDRGGVFGQRFDRLGQARGTEFAVNVTTAGTQFGARAVASGP
jgi:hypothetical protein